MRILLVCALALAITVPAVAAGPHFVQDRFVIGFWVDPPLDDRADARYAEIAEANFTMIIGGSPGWPAEKTKQLLDLCAKYGLKAVLHVGGVSEADLPDHPACWGYGLRDEPGAKDFPGLREKIDAVRSLRPGRLGYINLFPTYATPEQLGCANYDEHVRRFMDEVAPDVLSMDHYPLMRPDADGRDGYCENLEYMRTYSLQHNVPFWNFFNTMPYGNQYDPTEAQLRWQIFASLAYGAKGVLYFCYYTPISHEFPKGGAIITRDERRTRHYDQAKRINAALRNLGPTLMQLTSTGVVRIKHGDDPASRLANTPIASITKGAYNLGLFRHADGRRALLMMNDDHAYTSWPTVTFDTEHQDVLEVSPQTGRAEPVRDDSPDMDGLQLSFDSGEGRLFLLPAKP